MVIFPLVFSLQPVQLVEFVCHNGVLKWVSAVNPAEQIKLGSTIQIFCTSQNIAPPSMSVPTIQFLMRFQSEAFKAHLFILNNVLIYLKEDTLGIRTGH